MSGLKFWKTSIPPKPFLIKVLLCDKSQQKILTMKFIKINFVVLEILATRREDALKFIYQL